MRNSPHANMIYLIISTVVMPEIVCNFYRLRNIFIYIFLYCNIVCYRNYYVL